MPSDKTFITIAIDGGAATGKSSTSRALANRLNLMHVDTGAHYRTLTYALLQAGASADAPQTVDDSLGKLKLTTAINGRSALLGINSVIPSDADIRSPEVNAAVSLFAAIAEVRQFLFEYQREQPEIARQNNFDGIIMEGRDIGSVILPDADHRFFLYADEATRTARRAREGQTDSVAARDKLDSSRKAAPLTCPEGAIRVNTAPRSLEEVIETLCKHIEETA